MKKKALNSRLSLSKTTIARLSQSQSALLSGGGIPTSGALNLTCVICPPTRAKSCLSLCLPETVTGPILD